MKKTAPSLEIVLDKEWDKDIFIYFIDEKDDAYDFGYDRIVSLHPDMEAIRGKSDEEKLAVAGPYVDAYYASYEIEMREDLQQMDGLWTSMADDFFAEIEKIFGLLDFYNPKEIKAALSITKAGVIGDDNASFQIWYKTVKEPTEVRRHFAHEILHFFYYAYLHEKGMLELARNWDKAEIFNVVILGLPQFVSLIGKADQGYAQHERYFDQYRKLWKESKGLDDYLRKISIL